MKGEWIRKPKGETCTIFVHGILAKEAACWRHENGAYWPQLLADEGDLKEAGIYVFHYRTNFFSGSYSVGDVVDALYESLRLDEVMHCSRLDFVCHSMGGIVVRRFLVKRAVDLIGLGKRVGLFLVASPSLGSDYADWLEPLAKLFGHKQAEALRFVRDNQWLSDLDKDFKNLKESGKLRISGRELIEDKFVVVPGLWRKQVVEPFSAGRYFADELKIPGSDHFSIATPDGKGALQHRTLYDFLRRAASESPSSTNSVAAMSPEEPPSPEEVEFIAATDILPAKGAGLEKLMEDFLGADPLLGREALDALLHRGDEAQSTLFASPIGAPVTFQVWRRWLQYVRVRHDAVAPVLYERLAQPHTYRDTGFSALLCGGIPRDYPLRGRLYDALSPGFHIKNREYFPNLEYFDQHGHYEDLLLAYGYLGHGASSLWSIASCGDYYWKKLRIAGFRGACAAFARGNLDAADSIERFVSTVYDENTCYTDSHGMESIGAAHESLDINHALSDEDLCHESNFGAFAWWQRGDVADYILRDWSRHEHWRVRRFGAIALRHFHFGRLKGPLQTWMDSEPDEGVRRELQGALDLLEMDALLDGENGSIDMSSSGPLLGTASAEEVVVALARLGHAHPRLDAMRFSVNWYDRAIAALAFGHLRRNDMVLRTDRLLREASTPFETLMLATAVVLLGRDDLPHSLHDFLVDAGSRRHESINRPVDVRYIHRFLRVSLSDALVIAGTPEQQIAWKREFEPLPDEA